MIYTTGVGSLPHDSFAAGLEHVQRHYSLPFLPETVDARAGNVPRFLSHLLSQGALSAFCEKNWSRFPTEATNYPQIFSFVYDSALFFSRNEGKLVKSQLIGPSTLARLLQMQFPTVTEKDIYEFCTRFLRQKLKALLAGFSSGQLLIAFDEPMVAAQDGKEPHQLLITLLEPWTDDPRILPGVHCCQPWEAWGRNCFPGLGLSMDLTTISDQAQRIRTTTELITSNRPWLIAGIIDTSSKKESANDCESFDTSLKATLSQHPKIVAVSGGCGTGLRSLAFEDSVATTLAAFANP